MSNQTIRLAEAVDAPRVAALINAMDVHYRGPAEAPSYAATLRMVEHAFATREGTRFALVFEDGEAAAIACFAIARPGCRLSGLIFLKDIFVAETARDRGIGTALLRWLAAFARERGVGRIDLTTERDNLGAQRFYERLGGARQDKVFYRFELADPVLLGEDDIE